MPLPAEFSAPLARTIDDIAQDAEQRSTAHLAAHGMPTAGGNWIGHAGDTCPFCGQNIRGLPLIAAFRTVFSKRYGALADENAAAKV